MKAVLMNSADKTLGWNNGQAAHPNGNGGVLTTQALDDRVGVGRLNLDKAFDQYLSGTTDVAGTASGVVGTVENLGWDFGTVVDGTTNDYLLTGPLLGGSTFTATLDWFRNRQTVSTVSFQDSSFDNLDLELWSTAAGSPLALDFRVEEPLQQRRTLQLRDSHNGRVHAPRAADGRNLRPAGPGERRRLRSGLGRRRRARANCNDSFTRSLGPFSAKAFASLGERWHLSPCHLSLEFGRHEFFS